MASSGTVALSVDARFKPTARGREEVLISGTVRGKSSVVIEAGDLTLRTIKQFLTTPYSTATKGGPLMLFGSVNTAGSLMNSVTLNSLKGSQKAVTGTTHMGTIAGGTVKFSFIAMGA